MKKDTLFSRIQAGFKNWTMSLRHYLALPEESGESERYSFKDPYSDLDYLHDKEMERLVKALENTQNNSIRYQ